MPRIQVSLTDDQRHVLDVQAARTGRSVSALIRDAVTEVYGPRRDVDADLQAIDDACGAWTDRDFDGEMYVEQLRSGDRLREATSR